MVDMDEIARPSAVAMDLQRRAAERVARPLIIAVARSGMRSTGILVTNTSPPRARNAEPREPSTLANRVAARIGRPERHHLAQRLTAHGTADSGDQGRLAVAVALHAFVPFVEDRQDYWGFALILR